MWYLMPQISERALITTMGQAKIHKTQLETLNGSIALPKQIRPNQAVIQLTR